MVFHFVDRICSRGMETQNRQIIIPVETLNRSDRRESAKRKTGFMGPTRECDRQENLNDAAGSRRYLMFLVKMIQYLVGFTDLTAHGSNTKEENPLKAVRVKTQQQRHQNRAFVRFFVDFASFVVN